MYPAYVCAVSPKSVHWLLISNQFIRDLSTHFKNIFYPQGFHLNTHHLQSVGSDFCEALNGLNDSATNIDIQLNKDLNG